MSTVLGGASSFSDGPRVNSGFGESALLLPHAFEALFTEQQRNYSSAARAAFRRPPRYQLLGRPARVGSLCMDLASCANFGLEEFALLLPHAFWSNTDGAAA